jgi:opacity protein-like surface antigen
MKKSILTIAGSVLIAMSSVQFAAASENHQDRVHHRVAARDSNAYVAPAYDAVQPEWSGFSYSRGYSAPAGR